MTRRGNIIYATSNPGKVFRLSPQRAAEGTYTSLVRDAQTVADWGTLSWRASVPAGSRVDVFTRSGNTATPDETWSPWSGPYAASNGEEIKSPNARYLQWKAVLNGKAGTPVLTSVSAAYVQRNLRPKVTSLTVHPAGTVFQKPYPTGDPDIAGFDDQAPDRRILSATPNPGGAARPWVAAPTSAGCRRSCGAPKMRTTTSCGTRSCIAARGTPAGSR